MGKHYGDSSTRRECSLLGEPMYAIWCSIHFCRVIRIRLLYCIHSRWALTGDTPDRRYPLLASGMRVVFARAVGAFSARVLKACLPGAGPSALKHSQGHRVGHVSVQRSHGRTLQRIAFTTHYSSPPQHLRFISIGRVLVSGHREETRKRNNIPLMVPDVHGGARRQAKRPVLQQCLDL
jgi:hypothetical protein